MDMDNVRPSLTSNTNSATNLVQLKSFQISASEQSAVDSLNATLFSYVLMKEASSPDKLLIDLITFCGMTLPDIPKAQCSTVVYLPVVDLWY